MMKVPTKAINKHKSVTILQIAKMSNLATTTIAEILRNKPGYNAETRKYVFEMAEKLNYRPNYLSKALAGGKSHSIGIFCDSIVTNIWIPRIVSIAQNAHNADYTTSICFPTGETQEIFDVQRYKLLTNMLDRRVDGIVWMTSEAISDKCEQLLAQIAVPVVYVDWSPLNARYRVSIARTKSAQALAERLAYLGHREAGFFHTLWGQIHHERKIDTYASSFRKMDINFIADNSWILPENDSYSDKYDFIKNKLVTGKIPSVLLFENDESAALGYSVLYDLGLKIPDDVSVVGYDDLPIAQCIRPRLTTINPNFHNLGQAAFDILLAAIENPEATIEPVTFESELIIRESIGPVPI